MKPPVIICGLPRTASTWTCNVLAQNPELDVLHTSPVVHFIDSLSRAATDNAEIKGMLDQNEKRTDEQVFEAMRGVMTAFHRPRKTWVDKNRFWAQNYKLLKKLYPDAKVVVCLRDIRAIIGSFEKRHNRNPAMQAIPGYTVRMRMQNALGNDGMLSTSLSGVEELVLAEDDNVMFLKYEDLVKNPTLQLQNVYNHIGLPTFKHDMNKIVNTAVDLDALYLNKFPHTGTGKLVDNQGWEEWVPISVANEIMQICTVYNETFGYK